MLKMQTAAAVVLVGLLASSACSSSNSDAGGAAAGANAGGASGSGSTGGQGGTHAHAGAGGSATSASGGSAAGSGGSATAGEPGAAPACPGCASGFCLPDGTCVDCLPSNDHCPPAQYCTDMNVCAPGCKSDGSNCASGVCLDGHDCKSCIGDQECSSGHVCGAGQCSPGCSATDEGQQGACSATLTCCSLHCADLTNDSHHCGACGAACGNSQFCGLVASSNSGEAGAGSSSPESSVTCHDTTLSNLCSIPRVIVISDRDKNDTDGNLAPARAIGAALTTQCSSAPTISEELQNSPDALNITTGHPVSGGGTLLLVVGGPYFQNLEGYFERSSSLLYFAQTGGMQQFIDRATGAAVVSRTGDSDNLGHDFFVIQFMRDADSGSLVLNAQGFWLSGTVAATFEFTNVIAPALATYDKSWYAYEWTDANGDLAPDLNEIVLKASGP